MSRRKRCDWDPWNLDAVADDSTIGLFGPRGSGKTTIIINALERKRLARGIAMCPTPECFATYGEFIPRSYVYDYFSEHSIQRIMAFQYQVRFKIHTQWKHEIATMMIRHKEERAKAWKLRMSKFSERALRHKWSDRQIQSAYLMELEREKFENTQNMTALRSHSWSRKLELRKPHAMFIILDDLSSSKSAINSDKVKYLMNNGRHYGILLIIAVQYSMDFPQACRQGLDWVVMFFDTLLPNIERLFKNYVGLFQNVAEFKENLAEASNRSCALVIRKNQKSPSLRESVFLFEPEALFMPDRIFGNEQFLWVHNMFYSEDKFMHNMTSSHKDDISSKVRAKRGTSGGSSGRKLSTKVVSVNDEEDDIDVESDAEEKNGDAKSTGKNNSDEDLEERERQLELKRVKEEQFKVKRRELKNRMKSQSQSKRKKPQHKDEEKALVVVEEQMA